MHVIEARNVNGASSIGLRYLWEHGFSEGSRNGPVLVAATPVTTVYQRPMERVLLCPVRDANPFFHLMEALWMMGGRNDVSWPLYFDSHFADYSDDGKTIHGAYGNRWFNHFGLDQIGTIIEELRSNRQSRCCVLTMWSPADDLGRSGKDFPCNTHVYFASRGGRLDMTVCNRSNDIVWGTYGANAVHMSILHELIATAANFEMGCYYQVSNNYHLYTDVVPLAELPLRSTSAAFHDAYSRGELTSLPLIGTTYEEWREDLLLFFFYFSNKPIYRNAFFAYTATPMMNAWVARKSMEGDGLLYARDIEAPDWRKACIEWILRRRK